MSGDVMASACGRPWNGTTVRSRLFDAISLLLPAAEEFLVASMEECLVRAGDALDGSTRSDVERFVREERAHQKVHHRYNQGLVDATPGAHATALRASHAADELAQLDLPMKLALAAAFEYLTSVLSFEMLVHPYLLTRHTSPQGRIWRWHAREELAHSHVAMDVAARIGVSRGRCLLAYVVASGYLAFDVLRLWWNLCRCDHAAGVDAGALWRQAGGFFVCGIPALSRMAAGWARYFMPGRRAFTPAMSARD
jgi:predicted metal-dependent hydrolase